MSDTLTEAMLMMKASELSQADLEWLRGEQEAARRAQRLEGISWVELIEEVDSAELEKI